MKFYTENLKKGLGQYRVIPSPESNLITEREFRVLSENFNYRRKDSIQKLYLIFYMKYIKEIYYQIKLLRSQR